MMEWTGSQCTAISGLSHPALHQSRIEAGVLQQKKLTLGSLKTTGLHGYLSLKNTTYTQVGLFLGKHLGV